MDNWSRKKNGNILLLVLSVFICTHFIYTDFSIRQFWGYGILVIFLVLNLKSRITISNVTALYLLLVISVFVLFIMPASRHDKNTTSCMVVMILSTLFLMMASYRKSVVDKVCIVFQVTGLIFSLVFLVFRIFPNLYWSNVYPHLSDVTRSEADLFVSKGYGIPVGGGYTYQNYILACAILFSVGRLLSGNVSPRQKNLCTIIIVASFVGFILVGRRSEMLSLLLAIVIIVLIYNKSKKLSLNVKKAIAGIVAVVAMITLIYIAYRFGFLSRYIKTINSVVGDSSVGGYSDVTSGRFTLWKIAMELFKENPIRGVGWEKFVYYVPDYFSAEHGRGIVSHVHNDYLELLCENGVIGAAFVVIPRVMLAVITIKQAKRLKKLNRSLVTNSIYLNVVSLGIQLFFLILACIDPCIYQMVYWCFYAIAIIILGFSLRLEKNPRII